jgi:hypothetical protein
MDVLLLAVSAEDLTHDEEIKLIRVAAGFLFEGVESGGGEGSLAGEVEAAVFWGEEIVECGLREAESGLAFGCEGAFPDLELRGLLGLKVDLEEFLGVRALSTRFRVEVETWAERQRSS